MRPDERNDPFEKLAAAHRRLEENLNDLARAARALADPKGQAGAREVISDVICYFERSVTRHEEDEERSLFPRLAVLESLGPVIARLREDHARHQRAVDELRAVLQQDGGAGATEALPRLIAELQASYERHITTEEQQVFPVARRFLQPSALQSVSTEMDARRGRNMVGSGAKPGGGRGTRMGTRRGP